MAWNQVSDKIFFLTNKESSNIYFLNYDKKILIDCGHSVEINQNIDLLTKQIDLSKIDYLLLTHAHVDHVGACSYLQQHFPKLEVIASSHQIEYLKRRDGFDILKGTTDKFEKFQVDRYVSQNDTIKLDSTSYLQVIETPGHTIDSISFYLPSLHYLFSGDTIYEKKVSQLDYYQNLSISINSMLETLTKLSNYDIQAILPGHGRIQTNIKENLTVLSRKCRKFASDLNIAIINNFIPSVERYIYDHPGNTKKEIFDFFTEKLQLMQEKQIINSNQLNSDIFSLVDKLFTMMCFLNMITYNEQTDVVELKGQLNSYLIN